MPGIAANEGAVLICRSHRLIAALSVLRTQSERLCLLAFAILDSALKSCELNRTGTIFPLAVPFGRRGRPTFLAFFRFGIPEFLNDVRSPSGYYCITVIRACQEVFLCYSILALRAWLTIGLIG